MLRKSIMAAAAVCAALTLTSCFGNEDYMYSGLEMVNVVSQNRLQNDDGTVFNIVESVVGNLPADVKRAMISCDVLKNTEGKTDEYDIRLLDFAQSLVKDPILSGAAVPDTLGNDPICANQIWMTKGYINGLFQVIVLDGSKQEHTVNLVYDEARSHSDTLFFNIRHNAYGDSIEPQENRDKYYYYNSGYFSFPVSAYIPEGKESVVVHLDWDWFETAGGALIIQRKHCKGDITYKP